MNKELTMILPAHNEGRGIRKTILEIDASVPSNLELIIYVSEDGSSDNTREEVMKSMDEVSNSKVVLSEKSERLGYSMGVIRGIQKCKTELIGFMDADGQCDPIDIERLLVNAGPNIVVCGYRNPRKDSKARLYYSKAFNIAYRIFGGPKLFDPSSPFIICNTSDIYFLSKISPRLKYGFWWEFQIRMSRTGINIVEIPVNHRDRVAGNTQVYKITKLPNIVYTHLYGLFKLSRDLKN